MANNQGPKAAKTAAETPQSRSSNSAPGTRFRALRRTVAALIHLTMSASCPSASLQTLDPSPPVIRTASMRARGPRSLFNPRRPFSVFQHQAGYYFGGRLGGHSHVIEIRRHRLIRMHSRDQRTWRMAWLPSLETWKEQCATSAPVASWARSWSGKAAQSENSLRMDRCVPRRAFP
jgi:hypothetical protein